MRGLPTQNPQTGGPLDEHGLETETGQHLVETVVRFMTKRLGDKGVDISPFQFWV